MNDVSKCEEKMKFVLIPATVVHAISILKPGREGNSIIFHLRFLTHSACQYDVT